MSDTKVVSDVTPQEIPTAEHAEPCPCCGSTEVYETKMTPDGRRMYLRCTGCGAFRDEKFVDKRKIHSL